MRSVLFAASLLLSGAMTAQALALDAGDTMQSWKNASVKDRSALLDELVGSNNSKRATILKCMDETSTTAGHADLPIGEIAKACALSGNVGQPV